MPSDKHSFYSYTTGHVQRAAGIVFPALFADLPKTADIILFSATSLGQGGENHFNEQPYEYWRDLWLEQGFKMFDPVRSMIIANRDIGPWYCFNTFLHANAAGVKRLPAHYLDQVIDPAGKVPDLAPLFYRLRRAIMQRILLVIQTWIAKPLTSDAEARRTGDKLSMSGTT